MASCGDPGPCRVGCVGERPPTVVSESDRGSLKVRGCSSSMIDPHSHDHCHHSHGSASLVSPCSIPLLSGNDLGAASSCPSVSLCSSPSGLPSSSSVGSLSSSSEEESSDQPTRQRVPSSAMWSTSGDAWHKICQHHC